MPIIELILIKQSHKTLDDKPLDSPGDVQDPRMKGIIYSQFNVMQALSSLPNAAILVEGLISDALPTALKRETTNNLREIFPADKKLAEMDFNELSPVQTMFLWNNLGALMMFHLRLVSPIYQTTTTKSNQRAVIDHYNSTCDEIIRKYPSLYTKHLDGSICYLMPNEKKEYDNFFKEVVQRNPKYFYEREKEALDFALVAAKKSGKKLVALVFGADHEYGISELIKKEYDGRIVLKKIIDTTEGFWCAASEKHLEKLGGGGMAAYKTKDYNHAIEHYKSAVNFWKAAPKSTPTKQSSLCVAEFNLGSSFLKLSEEKKTSSEDAVTHLEQADVLSKKQNKRYHARYSEAFVRHQFISFFSEELWKEPVEIMLDYAKATPKK